ncbi:MAG TPA: AAA family ATPase [Solirubrobacteraceae bacterium]|jgi:exodeoxyribonuclease V alpha subunit|nr:AAA family ATPase [Solirubrobacteraceae bacterium]
MSIALVDFNSQVTVRRRRYASEESGWAVIEAASDDGESIVLVGPLIHLEERERAHVVGSWVDDSRYGMQVKVAEATPLPPTDLESVAIYLRRVKNVGPKRAQQLIDRYGIARVLDAVDADPEAAFAEAGLRRRAADEAAASWESMRVTRKLHLLLAPHGLAYLGSRLHDAYGDSAARVVSERPYELTSVFGVGFVIADRIAHGLGVAGDGPQRSRAAALHVLAEAERGGSTCLPIDALLGSLDELLGAPADRELIDKLVAAGDLVAHDRWIYRRQTAELEAELAARVLELVESAPSDRLSAEEGGESGGPELTDEQLTGVRNAASHRLSLITGGPGTGKTASLRAIAGVAAGRGVRVMLVAPTGRAAIRMSEASGLRARTVHSALGWIPGEGPTHDEQDPLPCDLLIVDETSMANLELLVTLLRAIGPAAHVVLVGDADQLAPVGAGKPFAELVASGAVPTARLTHIFRQAAGSMIVQGAHAIRRGTSPDFSASEGMRRDLFMIERANPQAALEEIVSLVSRRLPDHYGIDPVRDIQVFAPVYRGDLGIDALNEALREILNPDGRPVRGGRLRLGDKLMMTGRNLHDLGLMNGTLLTLLDEVSAADDDDDPALILSADDESVFRLPPEEADRLRLAYACSVHRGQGIELPVAIIVAHAASGAFFLRREMLYTAVTRSTIATVIVGTRDVVARAARTPDTGRRHSRLAERLT